MPSLTREEAEERGALLAVERYDIALDLTGLLDGPVLRAVSTVTLTCRRPGATSFVECAADVVAATLDGVPLAPPVDGRIALPDLPARGVLRVESVQDRTTDGLGVHRAVDPADGEVYVWTSFEPDEAHHVWACFDQPDLKAPHAFTVTAPAHWRVLSNSGTAQVEDVDGARRWTFADTPPLSVYNTVVDAGPFVELRREAGGHDLGLLARRSLAPLLERDADELFSLTAQGLAFFADRFGRPFAQRTYDQVFVPEFGGAMENWGCVTWCDTFLRRTPPTPAERGVTARYLLHELAHMWFGNLVTMRWWDDLWLNEAFAELAAHWAAVSVTPYTDVWAAHLAGEELRAYLADQGPGSHPVRQPVPDVAAAMATFDAITYPKGASVLQQLMVLLGEEVLAAGMRAYFDRHAWGTTTLQDLVVALEQASGRELSAWREGWLETAGTDRLSLEQDDDGLVLVASGPQGPPRQHVLHVGAYRRTGPGLSRTAVARVEVTGPRTRLDLPPGADLYLVNDDDLTFATTRTQPRDALFDAAPQLPTPLARGVAVASVWDMLLTGEASAAEVVRCLAGVLEAETSSAVVEPYLALAQAAAEVWAPAADRPALQALLGRACRTVAARPDVRRPALRVVVATAAGEDDLAWALAQEPEDVDLAWRALERASELGQPWQDRVAALLARDPDPEARVRALAVQAASPRAEDKAAAWAALEERSVPMASVKVVGGAFWRPGQDDVLAPYADRYLDLVTRLDGDGMMWATAISSRLFPVHGAGADVLDRAEALARTAPPVVATTLRDKVDLQRRVLRSRAQGGADGLPR